MTLKQLVQRIAPGARPVVSRALARQIQHWTVCGLFDSAGVPIEEKHVGRGRARRYPDRAAYWGALFWTMSKYGMPPDKMERALQGLNDKPEMVEQAIAGTPPNVMLLISDYGAPEPWSVTGHVLARGPLTIKGTSLAGTHFNLTAIFGSIKA